MSRNVNVVILCEDRQHEAFVRRFLKKAGFNIRDLRVEISPKGRGSAEQFVRKKYAAELLYYRGRKHKVQQALVVMIDDDKRGITARIDQVEGGVVEAGQQRRQADERVAIFVSARNIETWLAYLDGQDVNETDSYPRLNRPRDCQRHVDNLYEMCQQGSLRQPSPPSLDTACEEYRSRLQA
ncbi:MAG: hypothetical protein ACC628_07735 [Pirellulaceae bacterium]